MTIERAVLEALSVARISDEDEAAIQEKARDCLRGLHDPEFTDDGFICAFCRTVLA